MNQRSSVVLPFTTLVVIFALSYSATLTSVEAYVEALAANIDTGLGHFQPMVALLCGHGKFHNQYLDENKKWVVDVDAKATCTKNKLEILEYCRKVYPKKDIRNIVESGKYYRIDNWAKVGQLGSAAKRQKHFVKPYRCLEGVFQSDALLVPEHCVFDHIHNQTICQASGHWNATAADSCHRRAMQLQSYAMLLPCGVGIFSGVEFVCCPLPSHPKPLETSMPGIERQWKTPQDNDSSNKKTTLFGENDNDNGNKDNVDDDYYDDDDDDGDDEDGNQDDLDRAGRGGSSSTTTTTTTTTETPVKFYMSHFDSNKEHDTFKDAESALEDSHKTEVSKVMKEWSELEERYQDMRLKNPKEAEDFKKTMTLKFQKMVEALEEEFSGKKRQVISMHQQRVMSILNMRKKAAMDCYTNALEQVPARTRRIEKCLEKLLRALEKDRRHTLHHFRHMLSSFTKQALADKESLLDHLEDLIKMANQSLAMLDRVPSVADKIKLRMTAFWHNQRGVPVEQALTRQSELAIMDRYEEEVAQKQQERERQKEAEELKRQEAEEAARRRQKEEEEEAGASSSSANDDGDDDGDDGKSDESSDDSSSASSSTTELNGSTTLPSSSSTPSALDDFMNQEGGSNSNEIDGGAAHRLIKPNQASYMQSSPFHHNEPSYSMRPARYAGHSKAHWNASVYITLGFAGLALLTATVVGWVLLRKHTQATPHARGFVQVDQTISPEERHVAHMQINGYENPTYKFFETQETV